MEILIIRTLVLYGLTTIITQSKIFEPIREIAYAINDWFGEFMECPMCVGFWAGFVGGFLFYDEQFLLEIFPNMTTFPILMTMFAYGLYSSGINWMLYVTINFFEKKIELFDLKILETEQNFTQFADDEAQVKLLCENKNKVL